MPVKKQRLNRRFLTAGLSKHSVFKTRSLHSAKRHNFGSQLLEALRGIPRRAESSLYIGVDHGETLTSVSNQQSRSGPQLQPILRELGWSGSLAR